VALKRAGLVLMIGVLFACAKSDDDDAGTATGDTGDPGIDLESCNIYEQTPCEVGVCCLNAVAPLEDGPGVCVMTNGCWVVSPQWSNDSGTCAQEAPCPAPFGSVLGDIDACERRNIDAGLCSLPCPCG
jgi:hypothetical protein